MRFTLLTIAIILAFTLSYAGEIQKDYSDIQITKNLSLMSLAFTANQGQWDEKVSFRANAGGATMWFASDGAYYQFTRSIESEDRPISVVDKRYGIEPNDNQPDSVETMMIKAKFVGANPNPRMVGVDEIDYKCNYFIGNDQSKWATDVPNYSAVMYEEIYDGIDLKYYGNGKQMEYDFIVSPGADFSQIKIQYEGAESVSVNENGELVVTTKWGEVVEQKPVIYQMVNNSPVSVNGEYFLKSDNSFGFKMTGDFDSSLPLVIDPILSYSTYLGGSDAEYGFSIAVDGSGSAYVTGSTWSTNFPTLNPYQTDQNTRDVFVTKLSSSGNSLVYSTYLGGSGDDRGESIAVDGSGSAYVTGYTQSTNYPTLNPYQTDQANEDVFVTKLSSSGNSLVYSTYLGGSDDDRGYSIAVDVSGSAYVVGLTVSTNFPTENPYQNTYLGGEDVFVAKLSSSGNNLVYSTYLGGNSRDQAYSIVVDGSGSAYVTGFTLSTNFPTLNPYKAVQAGGDVFVTKLSSSGNSLVYSTYLGGSSLDVGYSIAVDAPGSAYVTGYTQSTDFPTENPYQTNLQGSQDAFVTKLSSSGNSLVYSTYLGGGGTDYGHSIVVDGSGSAYVTGSTASTDFPTLNPYQTDQAGQDAFVTKLSSSGSSLLYSTYLGGGGTDYGNSIVVDGSGSAYVTGSTASTDFPTLNPYQTNLQGGGDAFVTKLSEVFDNDGDGYTDDVDCDDNDPDAYPGAPEVPDDGVDQDCNGFDAVTCYVDEDQDGYGTDAGTVVIAVDGQCNAAQQESDNATDCDDLNPDINPGASEIPDDGIDQNCDGIDPCCTNPTGDINNDGGALADISDLLFLVDYMFLPPGTAPEPECMEETDVNGDGGATPDISDLLYLVDYMFLPPGAAPVPADCL